jgi:hypothetical protein
MDPIRESDLLFPSTSGGYRAPSCLDKRHATLPAWQTGILERRTARLLMVGRLSGVLLAALASAGGLSCVRPVIGRSAILAIAAHDADNGRVCEAAKAVLKTETASPAHRPAMQSTTDYARVRSAWRKSMDALRGQCHLRLAVDPKMHLPRAEMHVYVELDFDPIGEVSVPTDLEAPIVIDRIVARGAHVAYIEVIESPASPAPGARLTVPAWTLLPCPETSVDITFEFGETPGTLQVTSVPPRPWAELREAQPCNAAK